MGVPRRARTRISKTTPCKVGFSLKRDEIGLNRHRALALCLGMIFSENRFTLFRIMPSSKGPRRAGIVHRLDLGARALPGQGQHHVLAIARFHCCLKDAGSPHKDALPSSGGPTRDVRRADFYSE